ncbi:MAG: chalcone isomerase family protein [Candidatus Rokubacteria bacterium]|nr:chalcone isomerase family protein [Candidatus Rokubacteria bacterium]
MTAVRFLVTALTVASMQFPPTITVGDHRLALVSCGVRDTLWIDHYVAALYLPRGAPPAAVMDATVPKAVRLYIVNAAFLPDDIPEKWRPALERHLDADALARVRAAYRTLVDGDHVMIAYERDRGLSMLVNGAVVATASGHALVDALLEVWAEREPARPKLDRLIRTHPCSG